MQRADSGRCNGAPMVGGAEECDGWRRSECEMMGGGWKSVMGKMDGGERIGGRVGSNGPKTQLAAGTQGQRRRKRETETERVSMMEAAVGVGG